MIGEFNDFKRFKHFEPESELQLRGCLSIEEICHLRDFYAQYYKELVSRRQWLISCVNQIQEARDPKNKYTKEGIINLNVLRMTEREIKNCKLKLNRILCIRNSFTGLAKKLISLAKEQEESIAWKHVWVNVDWDKYGVIVGHEPDTPTESVTPRTGREKFHTL